MKINLRFRKSYVQDCSLVNMTNRKSRPAHYILLGEEVLSWFG